MAWVLVYLLFCLKVIPWSLCSWFSVIGWKVIAVFLLSTNLNTVLQCALDLYKTNKQKTINVIFLQISSKMAPWHGLLCKKSVFKNDTSVYHVLQWADVQLVGECVCFNFSICVTSLSPLSIWSLSLNPLEAMGHLLGYTVRIIRLITFQGKRPFSLIKLYNLNDDFFFF